MDSSATIVNSQKAVNYCCKTLFAKYLRGSSGYVFQGSANIHLVLLPSTLPSTLKNGGEHIQLVFLLSTQPSILEKGDSPEKKMLKNSSKTSKSHFQKKTTTCFLTMLLDKNFLIGKLLNFCLNLIISPLPYNIPGGVYFFRLVHIKSNIVLIRTVPNFGRLPL